MEFNNSSAAITELNEKPALHNQMDKSFDARRENLMVMVTKYKQNQRDERLKSRASSADAIHMRDLLNGTEISKKPFLKREKSPLVAVMELEVLRGRI